MKKFRKHDEFDYDVNLAGNVVRIKGKVVRYDGNRATLVVDAGNTEYMFGVDCVIYPQEQNA